MLTMVSISAVDGLNEGLSKSLSLKRKICDLSSNLDVRENAGAAVGA